MKATIKARFLRSAIAAARPYMSKTEKRHYPCGMRIVVGPSWVEAVATDGHRLMRARRQCVSVAEEGAATLPAEEVRRLLGFLDDITNADAVIEVKRDAAGNDWIIVTYADYYFRSGGLSGTYPDYERFLSQKPKNDILLNRKLLREMSRSMGDDPVRMRFGSATDPVYFTQEMPGQGENEAVIMPKNNEWRARHVVERVRLR